MDSRRRHGWPFWFAGVLCALPMLYVLSFGPACWWFAESVISHGMSCNILNARGLYWPMGWIAENGPDPVCDAINWYGTLFGSGWVHVPTKPSGDWWIVLIRHSP